MAEGGAVGLIDKETWFSMVGLNEQSKVLVRSTSSGLQVPLSIKRESYTHGTDQ